MSEDQDLVYGPVADPTVVRQLTSRLMQAYEDFINTFDGRVEYVEGFMAAHNFHVFVVEHLVEETGSDVWRNGAATTFERRMKNPGEYDTKGEPNSE
ncbi:MAG: hypothetical protein R3D55_25865 [Chloroflexota bacterium]